MASLIDNYVSSSEAAQILRIHPFTIQKLLQDGRLRGEKIANRWLISRIAVDEYAQTYNPRRGRPGTKRKYTKRSPIWFNN